MAEEYDPAVVLDYYIFHNIHNAYLPGNMADRYEVTYEGDNYVIWDTETDELHHFRVVIEPHEWDSTQAREDQEWDV